MHDLSMATKTISIEIDSYELLVRERRDPKESFSRVIRRILSERQALSAGDLLAAMQAFEGKGAGARRSRRGRSEGTCRRSRRPEKVSDQ
jgi:predicted CopG family antitoxin